MYVDAAQCSGLVVAGIAAVNLHVSDSKRRQQPLFGSLSSLCREPTELALVIARWLNASCPCGKLLCTLRPLSRLSWWWVEWRVQTLVHAVCCVVVRKVSALTAER
jgi:hypothetical protein